MFSGLFLVPFLPVSLVSLGTDPLLSNSSPFSTACMNLYKPRLNLMLYTLISGKPSTASPIMSFFSNSGVLASEAISGAGSKRIYPTECNVLLLTAIPLVCYLCYLVFPKGAFLVHFYSFSLLMTSLSLSARPPCSSLLTMPNISVPLLPSDCSLLQDDLIRLLDWSNKWKLHFNISKCALVRFSYGTPISPASSYCMGDQDIVALDCLRDLGVLISDELSWSAHYDLLCSRAYKILG